MQPLEHRQRPGLGFEAVTDGPIPETSLASIHQCTPLLSGAPRRGRNNNTPIATASSPISSPLPELAIRQRHSAFLPSQAGLQVLTWTRRERAPSNKHVLGPDAVRPAAARSPPAALFLIAQCCGDYCPHLTSSENAVDQIARAQNARRQALFHTSCPRTPQLNRLPTRFLPVASITRRSILASLSATLLFASPVARHGLIVLEPWGSGERRRGSARIDGNAVVHFACWRESSRSTMRVGCASDIARIVLTRTEQ
ncbi:hypothetical protein ANO11243_015920 [Dothideomycetidae sp. 11243]|nr:hypothetical protein ANO11243_015920 [fungal sp. No.11243]